MPFHRFTSLEEVTAATMNTYVGEQVVGTYANAAARTTALTGGLAKPGMITVLLDTLAVEMWTGTNWRRLDGAAVATRAG
jgi:hypothetical protein